MTETPSDSPVADLVARCIVALEAEGPEGGQAAVDAILATDPEHATVARQQLNVLIEAGLLEVSRAVQQQIGPYRIIQPLGRGGMGMVYLAEQRTPVRRQVAVKVLHRELCQPETLARFEQERNALALVAHPNICTVFDAGTMADGQPWIAMEYVRGSPITEYCARRHMTLGETLRLFAQVCDAVQHAHQRGVLHRDLKPSNILVADRGNQPFPVVIDFGVAKSTRGNLGDRTLHTQIGRVLGTPGYMSPEQAHNEDNVDTRTDVYSLGMVLFELLSGRAPMGSQDLRTSPQDPRPVRTNAGPRMLPSVAAAAPHDDAPSTTSASARFAPRALRHELDWIVGRATEDDPNRRYPMPAALADDVRRYLRKDPVEARAPSPLYRVRKLVQRHWRTAAIAALVFVAMGIATATSLVFSNRAQDSAALADRNQARATLAIDRMLAELASEELAWVPELGPVRRRLLENARDLYEQMLAEPTSPTPQGQLARAHTLVRRGRVQLLLSSSDRTAVAPLQEAEAIYAAYPLLDPSSRDPKRTTAPLSDADETGGVADRLLCASWCARAARANLDSKEIERQHRNVLRIAKRWEHLPDTQLPLVAEAALALASKDPSLFREAVAIYDALGANDARHQFDAAATVGRHTEYLLKQGELQLAQEQEQEFRRRLVELEKFADRKSPRLEEGRAQVAFVDGAILSRNERELEGMERLQLARRIHLALLPSDPDPSQRFSAITATSHNIADGMCVYGRTDEARDLIDSAIALLRDHFTNAADDPRLAVTLAHTLQIRASIEVAHGELYRTIDTTTCDRLLRESEALLDELNQRHTEWAELQDGRVAVLATRAVAYSVADDPRKLEACRIALEARLENAANTQFLPSTIIYVANARLQYATALKDVGEIQEARQVLRASIHDLDDLWERTNKRYGPASLLANSVHMYADLCLADDDRDSAREALDSVAIDLPLSPLPRIETARLWILCGEVEDLGRAEEHLSATRSRTPEPIETLTAGQHNLVDLVTAGRFHQVAAQLAAARGQRDAAARGAYTAIIAQSRAISLRPERDPKPLIATLSIWFAATSGHETATDDDWTPLHQALRTSSTAAALVRTDPQLEIARERSDFNTITGL